MKIRCPFCTQMLDLTDEIEPVRHVADHFQQVREASAEVSDEQLILNDTWRREDFKKNGLDEDEAGNHISEK